MDTNPGDHHAYQQHTTPRARRNHTQPALQLHGEGMPILHNVLYSPVFENRH